MNSLKLNVLFGIALLCHAGTVVMAQQETDTPPPIAVSEEDDTESADPGQSDDPDTFTPTEQIRVDSEISFPVDI